MKTNAQDQRSSYNEFTKQLRVAMFSNSFIFRFIGIGIFIMLVPGILFACILFGLFYGFEKIALISDPAYQVFRKLLRLHDMPMHLVKPPLWYVVYNCVSLVFPGFFIYIGIRGLPFIGLCNQSVVCTVINLVHNLI